MDQILRRIITTVKTARKKHFFMQSQPNSFNLNSEQIRKAKKLGFTPDEYAIYDLERNDPDDYISEFERMLFRDTQAEKRILLDNKVVFYQLVRTLIPTNRIYAYKENGFYVRLESGFQEEFIIKKLRDVKRIVYKKSDAGGGEGFKLLEYRDGSVWINRIQATEEDVEQLIRDDNYLIEEYCVQSGFENALYPYSVNTIRLITVVDDGEVEVVAAMHRMGVDENKCVDNACAGGVYAEINISSGKLSAARSHGEGRLRDPDGNIIEYKVHPVTNAQIEGLVIPEWESIVKQVVGFHNSLRFTGLIFIAWDVALTEGGIKIIEANTSCSMDFLQTFHGQRNTEFGKWMKKRGYIR